MSTRYPYTYAADLIRGIAGMTGAGHGQSSMRLGRAEAARIHLAIAEIIGMPPEEMAKKLADHCLAQGNSPSRGKVGERPQHRRRKISESRLLKRARMTPGRAWPLQHPIAPILRGNPHIKPVAAYYNARTLLLGRIDA